MSSYTIVCYHTKRNRMFARKEQKIYDLKVIGRTACTMYRAVLFSPFFFVCISDFIAWKQKKTDFENAGMKIEKKVIFYLKFYKLLGRIINGC